MPSREKLLPTRIVVSPCCWSLASLDFGAGPCHFGSLLLVPKRIARALRSLAETLSRGRATLLLVPITVECCTVSLLLSLYLRHLLHSLSFVARSPCKAKVLEQSPSHPHDIVVVGEELPKLALDRSPSQGVGCSPVYGLWGIGAK